MKSKFIVGDVIAWKHYEYKVIGVHFYTNTGKIKTVYELCCVKTGRIYSKNPAEGIGGTDSMFNKINGIKRNHKLTAVFL